MTDAPDLNTPIIKTDTNGGQWTLTADRKDWQPVKQDTQGNNWTLSPDRKSWVKMASNSPAVPNTLPATSITPDTPAVSSPNQNPASTPTRRTIGVPATPKAAPSPASDGSIMGQIGQATIESGKPLDDPLMAKGMGLVGAVAAPEIAGTAAGVAGLEEVPYAMPAVRALAQGLYNAGESELSGEGNKTAAKSALWGAGLSFIPEAGLQKAKDLYGQAAPVLNKVSDIIGDMKSGKVKAAAKIAQAYKDLGWSASDASDLAKDQQAATRFGQMYQNVKDFFGNKFSDQYTSVLSPYDKVKVDPAPILGDLHQTLDTVSDETGNPSGVSPGVKKFIGEVRDRLEGPQYAENVDKINGNEILSNKNKSIKISQLTPDPTNINNLRDIQSSIRSKLRGSVSNTDKLVLSRLEDSTMKTIDDAMVQGGASPDDLTKLRSIDSNYRNYRTTLDMLGDPRKATYPHDAANALLGAIDSNDYEAVNGFIKMAQEASTANPEIMPTMRQAALTKLWSDSAKSAGDSGESTIGIASHMRQNMQKLGNRANEGMKTLFGADNPITNQETQQKIFKSIGDPDARQKALQQIEKTGTMMPHFMTRMLIINGLVSGATGAGSIYALSRGNAPLAVGLGMTALFGMPIASKIFSSGNTALQKAYTKMLLNPSSIPALRAGTEAVTNYLAQTAATKPVFTTVNTPQQ